MVDIVFFPDYEPEHVRSTFRTARNLQAKGYKIAYFCVADVQDMIKAEGFRALTVFEDLYPKGTLAKVERAEIEKRPESRDRMLAGQEHRLQMIQGCLDEYMHILRPRLIISSCFIPLESLILHYKYKVEQMIYHPMLPSLNMRREKPDLSLAEIVHVSCLDEIGLLKGKCMRPFLQLIKNSGQEFSRMNDIVNPIGQMPQLLICPKEVEVVDMAINPNEVIAGPGIDDDLQAIEYRMMDYLPAEPGKELLFASLGPRVQAHAEQAKQFFNLLMSCMRQNRLKNYHLIISIGSLDRSSFTNVPDNVTLHNWVPQGQLLKHLSMAIIHGGLGTTKECINAGVPMLVLPLDDDQFDNAKRVEHHHLGVQADIETLDLDELTQKITFVLHSQEVRKNVSRMEALFHEAESKQAEVAFIYDFIGGSRSTSLVAAQRGY